MTLVDGEDPRTVDAPSMVPDMPRPDLLSVEDAKAMRLPEMTELFMAHMNPGQFHFMKLLGFHRVKVESASGMYYTDQNGRKILDFFGGFGSLAFGHNHPRVLAARKRFQDEDRHEIAIAFMSQYAAALAKNLAAIAPGDLDMVFLGSSGSEAMEAAIKVAERAQGPKRSTVLYAENAFHGKTKGVLSMTDSELYQSDFKLVDNTRRCPSATSKPCAARSTPTRRSASSASRRSRAAAASSRRRRSSGRVCASSATSAASFGSPTRCSAAWAAPAASSPSRSSASCRT